MGGRGGGGGREGRVEGGQGGCERRIDVFVKLEKKNLGGRGGGGGVGLGGVRVDVIEELKFFGKIHTKKNGGSGGVGSGVGLVWGGSGWM